MDQPNNIIFSVLTVKHKQYITPHFIRVTLTGTPAQLQAFAGTAIGENNKLYIPPAGETTIDWPVFSDEAGGRESQARGAKPVRRTYTMRKLDIENLEMVIEFVAHGVHGPGSKWAIEAQEGDQLGVAMKLRSKPLYPAAQHYVLAGDATALPVIAAILETLPATATARVILEVHGPEDEQQLFSAAGVSISWLYNARPELGSELAGAVKAMPLPETGSGWFMYAAAEDSTVKEIRRYLKDERQWQKSEMHAVTYWTAGVIQT